MRFQTLLMVGTAVLTVTACKPKETAPAPSSDTSMTAPDQPSSMPPMPEQPAATTTTTIVAPDQPVETTTTTETPATPDQPATANNSQYLY